MKRFFATLLMLAFCFSLSACACKHSEWNEASCEKPETCKECGETKGDALEHSWNDASCSTPKTCGRCGATEGMPVEHSYSAWKVDGEEQKRFCVNCNAEERKTINREEICAQVIAGTWESVYAKNNLYEDYKMTADTLKNFALCFRLVFNEKGTGSRIHLSHKGTENTDSLTWQFVSYEKGIYTMELIIDDAMGPQRRTVQYYADAEGDFADKLIFDIGAYHIMEKQY